MPETSVDCAFHAQSAPEPWLGAERPKCFVTEENCWRLPPKGESPVSASRVQATRWRSLDHRPRDCIADAPGDCHVVKLVLRSMDMHLAVGARTVQDGIAAPGTFHVTEPGTRVAALFRGPYDALHLYIPDRLMRECAGSLHRDASASLPSTTALAKDPAVDSLARALMNAELSPGEISTLYVDCISIALVVRLLHTAVPSTGSKRPKVAQMARWRLERAIEFIDAGLEQSLSLADISGASGLSRMHFAAQFRASTGLRPHEFVLRRRVERAQEMLAGTEKAIVDVAMSVGFQTQAHFTTIFKRFVGQTPQAWRRSFAGS